MRVRKYVAFLVVLTVLVAMALMSSGTAVADPPPCEPGQTTQGCKSEDDPDKNNDKFQVTQRGNIGAPGTAETCTGANPGQTKKVCP